MPDTSHPAPPLVFVYDRSVTGNRLQFLARLQACGDFARRQGWQIGGWFADAGEDALTEHRRPGLDSLLHYLDSAGNARRRILLVYDWDRLATGLAGQARHVGRARLYGAEAWSVCAGACPAPHTALGQLVALVAAL